MKKRLLRFGFSFIMLLMLFPVTALAEEQKQEARYQTAAGDKWITGTFSEAISNVYDGGTIQLLSEVVPAGGFRIQKSITITSADSQAPCKIILQANHGTLFIVDAGGNLRFQNIMIDGGGKEGYTSTSALIGVNGGSLCLAAGASIQNNDNTKQSGAGGGIVLIAGSAVLEEGSQIVNCKASKGSGGGVGVSPNAESFIINGGTIRDCEAAVSGGGVYFSGKSFLFKKGAIEGNTTHANNYKQGGGGIFVSGGSVLIEGGEIKNNRSDYYGGGIFEYAGNPPASAGTVRMSGGSLSGNSAKFGGGFAGVAGSFELLGGSITKNHADVYGGGILSPYGFHMYLSGNPKVSENEDAHGYQNFYLDGNEDQYPDMPTWPINMTGALGKDTKIGISRWIEPNDEHPARIVAVPADGYVITEADRDKFVSDNPKFAVILQKGNLVLVKAVLPIGIALEPKELTLTEGDSEQLTVSITPEEATNRKVVWSSEDESIATVDENGRITAVKEGSTIITVTTEDGLHTDSCKVKVLPRRLPEPETPVKPTEPEKPIDRQEPEKPIQPEASMKQKNPQNTSSLSKPVTISNPKSFVNPQTKAAKTADSGDALLWAALLFLSAVGLRYAFPRTFLGRTHRI